MFDSTFTESTELKNVNTNPYKRIYQSLYRKGLKNSDSADFGGAASPSNPEDLNIQDAATRYDTESKMTCLLDYIKQFAKI